MNYSDLAKAYPVVTSVLSEEVFKLISESKLQATVLKNGKVVLDYGQVSSDKQAYSIQLVPKDRYLVSYYKIKQLVSEEMTGGELATFTGGIFTDRLTEPGHEKVFGPIEHGWYDVVTDAEREFNWPEIFVKKLPDSLTFRVNTY